MKAIAYHTKDKTGWADGPWMHEPDKLQWADEETGLPCLIVRGGLGALCGYVGVPRSHPAYGKHYDDEALLDIGVHGGLTFSDKCQHDGDQTDVSQSICHVVEPGEDDDVWWVGFDCAHAFDLVPGMEARLRGTPWPVSKEDTYRDVAYVKNEIRSLAKQLKEMDGARDQSAVGQGA